MPHPTIQEIYTQLSLPPGLIQHMYLVAALGSVMSDFWKGPTIDTKAITTALLLHDLGNLVKIDLSHTEHLLDHSLAYPYWQQLQDSQKKQYGNTAHQATLNMARQYISNETVLTLIDEMDGENLQHVLESSWELQICEYADLRVSPTGIISLKERLRDIQKRYAHRSAHWAGEENFQAALSLADKLEKTLQRHSSISLTQIPSEKIQAYLVKLPHFTVEP